MMAFDLVLLVVLFSLASCQQECQPGYAGSMICTITSNTASVSANNITSLHLEFVLDSVSDQLSVSAVGVPDIVINITYLSYMHLREAVRSIHAPHLQTLTLKRDLNKGEKSIYLDAETFTTVKTIQTLNLNELGVGKIHKDTFKGLDHVNVIDLSLNYLEDIPAGSFETCKNLTILKLQGNFIEPENLLEDSFSGPTSLHWLNLEKNSLSYLPAGRFVKLGTLANLVLTHNDMRFVEPLAFQGLKNLHYLSLSNNKLRSVPTEALSLLPNLFSLDLSYNELDQLDTFKNLTHLEIIYLQYTNLKTINGFQELSNLRELHLRGNSIDFLNGTQFVGLTSLVSLDVSDNNINYVDDSTFIPIPMLQNLNLGRNKLKELDEKVFEPLEALEQLQLEGNNWNCSCQLQWLFIWIHGHEASLTNEHQLYVIHCSSPPDRIHYTFYDLRYNLVLGCDEEGNEKKIPAGESREGSLTDHQRNAIIGAVVTLFVILVLITLVIVYIYRKKHRFWKPKQQQPGERRTPSWCKDPSPPPLPTRDYSTEKGFVFDNKALETSMLANQT